ncbi:SCP2 sterol-binding domain-containing protein [Salinibacter altiplanensis]|uniref:SCP2 sterol-binding domain-containing protein n=1 Tax=Salinibacter altiplanensis TaxID=1803181 RepID=UPI000C9F4E75|nr:SCP2 sterol-binding domain-containing protein [Salinibacter altiplanensis]
MSDAPRYWMPEYVERFVEALNDDDAFQDTAGSFSETIELCCLDTPDDEDVSATYTFEGGQVTDADVWIDEAPSEQMREEGVDTDAVMARATAPYDVWVQMDQGEMGATEAIASPDYKIDGSMMQIMSNMGVFRGMMSVAADVEKTY